MCATEIFYSYLLVICEFELALSCFDFMVGLSTLRSVVESTKNLCGYKSKKELHRCNSLFVWCHQESNRGHKDFQSFALPTELWHHRLFCECKVNRGS